MTNCKCENLPLTVCKSAAGYYVGKFCPNCGPYSRESGYFGTRQQAASELADMLEEEDEG